MVLRSFTLTVWSTIYGFTKQFSRATHHEVGTKSTKKTINYRQCGGFNKSTSITKGIEIKNKNRV